MTEQFPAIRGNSPFKQTMLGGYDRFEVDEYVARLESRIEELEQERSPDGAVQRALEQVGDEVAGILQRAHETAAQLTESARQEATERDESSRREATERLEAARREAAELLEAARRESDERVGASHRDASSITSQAENRLRELDVDADKIWAERERLVTDVRYIASQLLEVADAAAERFPPDDATVAFDVEEELARQAREELSPEDTQPLGTAHIDPIEPLEFTEGEAHGEGVEDEEGDGDPGFAGD